MGSIGIGQLLIIAVIVVLLFGTKKLKTLGSDLGSSIKGFKKAMSDDDEKKDGVNRQPEQDADFREKTLEDKTHLSTSKDDIKNDKQV